MGWMKDILLGDPYEHCPTRFMIAGTFPAATAGGYRIRYKLTCQYRKVDGKQFKSAQMLQASAKERFINTVNSKVVIPALQREGRFIRFHEGRYRRPELCSTIRVKRRSYVARDHNCSVINSEVTAAKFEDSGCAVESLTVDFCDQIEGVIEINYNHMIQLYDVSSFKNTPEYVSAEEATRRLHGTLEQVIARSVRSR